MKRKADNLLDSRDDVIITYPACGKEAVSKNASPGLKVTNAHTFDLDKANVGGVCMTGSVHRLRHESSRLDTRPSVTAGHTAAFGQANLQDALQYIACQHEFL